MWRMMTIGAVLTATLACGGEQDPLAALARAKSGETVVLPDGTYDGPLVVPAGVTLQSQRVGGAVVRPRAGESGGAVVIAETGPGAPTVVGGLIIEAAADVGLLVRGAGAMRGEGLELRCRRGIGLAAEGAASLSLIAVQLRGSITEADLPKLAFPVKGSQAPVAGLVLSRVGEAVLKDVSLSGFGGFGAVLVDSKTQWSGGAVAGNVGVGIMQDGGSLTVTGQGIEVRQTMAGELGTAILAYGLVVKGRGRLTSSALKLSRNRGVGLLQHEASSEHHGLTVEEQTDVGVWVQSGAASADQPALLITKGGRVVGNRGGGIFALGAGAITVRESTVSGTLEKQIPVDETGLASVADGVQVVKPAGSLELRDLTLLDNRRVGLLLSGALPAGASATLSGVQIRGQGSYGLIVEDGHAVSPAWQLERDANLAQADAAFTGRLAVAVTQAVPSVDAVRSLGLVGEAGLLGPTGRAVRGASVGRLGLTPEND